MLATIDGVAYAERVAVNTAPRIIAAKKAIKKAFKVQIERKGFSIIEVLSTCPTNWGMTPTDAMKRVEDEMIPYFPLGVFCDRTDKGVF